MKIPKIIILILVTPMFFLSCKKTNLVTPVPISAFTIVNATVGASPIVPNFSSDRVQWFSSSRTISYGSSFEYSIPSTNVPVSISQLIDTTHTLYNGMINLKPATIYSLFLSGKIVSGTAQIDTLLSIDNPPYHSSADSVVGIRFVNLSLGSTPVSINIKGKANGSEVSSLPYKTITAFKTYTDTKTIPTSTGYVFEFRNAALGTLLATYSYPYNSLARFRNVTIVLKGLPGGTGSTAQGTFLVSNY